MYWEILVSEQQLPGTFLMSLDTMRAERIIDSVSRGGLAGQILTETGSGLLWTSSGMFENLVSSNSLTTTNVYASGFLTNSPTGDPSFITFGLVAQDPTYFPIKTVTIGYNATSRSSQSVVIGTGASDGSGGDNVTLGYNSGAVRAVTSLSVLEQLISEIQVTVY
jgi:hypothetical protein